MLVVLLAAVLAVALVVATIRRDASTRHIPVNPDERMLDYVGILSNDGVDGPMGHAERLRVAELTGGLFRIRGAMGLPIVCAVDGQAVTELIKNCTEKPEWIMKNVRILGELTRHIGNFPGRKEWSARRKAFHPSFHRFNLAGYRRGALRKHIGNFCARLRTMAGPEPVNVHYLLGCLTTDVICDVGFGSDAGALQGTRNLAENLFITTSPEYRYCMFHHPMLPIFSRPRKLVEARKVVREELRRMYREFEARYDATEEGSEEREQLDKYVIKDVLTLRRTHPGYGEENAISDMGVLIFGGFDTSSLTAMWMLHLLVRNRDKMRIVQQELDAAGTDGPTPYLEACIKETMRCYPAPGNAGLRVLRRDVTVKGITIPDGTLVAFPIHAIHNYSGNWEKPGEFRPERFLEDERLAGGEAYKGGGDAEGKRMFMPFHMGRRRCLGMQLALAELRILMAEMLRIFSFDLPSGAPDRLGGLSGMTLHPEDPMLIVGVRGATVA